MADIAIKAVKARKAEKIFQRFGQPGGKALRLARGVEAKGQFGLGLREHYQFLHVDLDESNGTPIVPQECYENLKIVLNLSKIRASLVKKNLPRLNQSLTQS